MFKTLRLRHFFGAIAVILGVAALAFAAHVITVLNPSGDCTIDDDAWTTPINGDCEDLATGLLWSSSAIGRTGRDWRYADAVTGCSNLVEGGYTDWRLPTIKEIQTAANDGAYAHVSITSTVYRDGVPDPPFTVPTIPSIQWAGKNVYWVSLVNGAVTQGDKKLSYGDYRCVRP